MGNKRGKGSKTKRQYSDSEIAKLVRSASCKSVDRVVLTSLMALRDEFGFSKGRMCRYLNKVMYLNDSVSTGYVKAIDLKKAIEEETGLMLDGILSGEGYK